MNVGRYAAAGREPAPPAEVKTELFASISFLKSVSALWRRGAWCRQVWQQQPRRRGARTYHPPPPPPQPSSQLQTGRHADNSSWHVTQDTWGHVTCWSGWWTWRVRMATWPPTRTYTTRSPRTLWLQSKLARRKKQIKFTPWTGTCRINKINVNIDKIDMT